MPNALLVYPVFPPSYWGFKFALDFVGKKSFMPPLGLVTVAGMFPKEYQLRVVDMNVQPLTETDLNWADLVFTSTMIVQQDSLQEVIERSNRAGVTLVVGGPHPTTFYEDIEGVDHFVLDEVEDILPGFFRDLQQGTAKKIYRASEKPDVARAPLPRYDLLNLSDYEAMALQFSRGCPFDCEFCDITKLYGRVARTKTNEQVLEEFDQLYRLGWRGSLFLVDDNFIGNKRAALALLPHVAKWQKERGYPFKLFTEASVNLARLEPLLDAMVEAGFSMTFLGIETPNPEALLITKKKQNTRKSEDNYLLNAVRTIQKKGIEVTAGFIVGLDGDDEGSFDAQIQFIQEAGIPKAMVGLLTALKGTDLYHRLQSEGRLLEESEGNNVSVNLNFIPQIDPETLIKGYKRVLRTIYDPTLRTYFERCFTMLKNLKQTEHTGTRVTEIGKTELMAIAKSFRRQLLSKQGPAYLKFLIKVAIGRPKMLPEAIRLAVFGYHFERITSQQINVHEFSEYLTIELDGFKDWLARAKADGVGDVQTYAKSVLSRVRNRYDQIHEDFRYSVTDALDSFHGAVTSQLDQLEEPVSVEI